MELPGEVHGRAGICGPQVQLEARGPQDLFLSEPPEASLLAARKPRQHFPFGRGVRLHDFDLSSFFGRSNRVVLDQSGDLVGPMHLRVELPALVSAGHPMAAAFEWVPRVGRALYTNVSLRCGDYIVESHDRLYLDFSDKCRLPSSKRAALDAMLGGLDGLAIDRPHEIIVPLQFFCCSSDSRRFLPVARMRKCEVRVHVEVEELWRLVRSRAHPGAHAGVRDAFAGIGNLKFHQELVAEHVLLTDAERLLLRADTSPLLIETVHGLDVTDLDVETGAQSVQASIVGSSLPGALKFVMVAVYRMKDASEGTLFRYVEEPFTRVTRFHDNVEGEGLTPIACGVHSRFEYGARCDVDGVHLITYALRPFVAGHPSGSASIDELNDYRVRLHWSDEVCKSPALFRAKAFFVVWQRLKIKNDSCTLSAV